MYAMIGKLTAQPGQRKDLVAILTQAAQAVGELPACRLYLVSEDVADDVTVHIFEAWDDQASHDASLQLGQVRALISLAMPLLAGAPDGRELYLVGGHGLG